MSLLTTIYKFIKPELTDSPPDITVTNENWDKVDTELKRQDDDLASHKAEKATYYSSIITRDLTLTGTQIVSGFPFIPEFLIFDVIVNATSKICLGKMGSGRQYSRYIIGANWYRTGSYPILIANTGADATRATVTINQDNTITLGWSLSGVGATGTAEITITAFKHGGN